MKSKTRQKFRIYHSGQKRIIYIACSRNDTSITFSEWGWEVSEHFTGKWETLALEEDGSILMESTGILDESEELIFEGDLVLVKSGVLQSENPYEIRWNDAYACFAFYQNEKLVKMIDKIGLRTINVNDIHIVGNIYENK